MSDRMPSRPDPTQPGNPHGLTVRQHIFPTASMKRFIDVDRCVDLADIGRKKHRRARPNDPIFCANRAWSHGAESGYMKAIEDTFQGVVEDIRHRVTIALSEEENFAISKFYALWHVRSRRRHLEEQYVTPNGILGGEPMLQDELEILEKNGYATIYDGNKFAMRDLNSGIISIQMGQLLQTSFRGAKWGVVQAVDGEFMVPDAPVHGVIPIEPSLALIVHCTCGLITKENLAVVNVAMKSEADTYVFARSLDNCPGVMPIWPTSSV